MKVQIQWEDNWKQWRAYQTLNHRPTAVRTAQQRSRSTGKRHRLVDEEGRLLDLIDP